MERPSARLPDPAEFRSLQVGGARADATTMDIVLDDLHIEDVDIDGVIAKQVTEGRLRVPALPAVVARVGHAASGGASLNEVVGLLEADPSVGASVLRLASSPAFTRTGDKVSLPYAVLRIGLRSVRGVCFTSPLARAAMRPGPLLPLRRRIWRECVAGALVCEALASFHGAAPDEAYLLGLLHDYGKIIALSIIEESSLGGGLVVDDPYWHDVIERHHCDIGWILSDRWSLPTPIPEATATHHMPPDGPGVALLRIVRLADTVVSVSAARGWQISAEDIERIDGVRSKDEAMATRIGLAKHPYFVEALV